MIEGYLKCRGIANVDVCFCLLSWRLGAEAGLAETRN